MDPNVRHRLHLSIRISLETPLNIGGYGAPLFVDQPFRRDRDGWPYIPASSLKGRLRYECERLVRGLGQEVCVGPNPRQMCRKQPCPICSIFGSPWVPGHIYPMDLPVERPTGLGDQPPPSSIRYHVSISRQRGVAEEGRLFTTEMFLPGVPLTFTGTWEADLSLKELALVEAGLGAITALGRGKTGGLGWCRITVQSQVQEGEIMRAITEAEREAGRAAWRE